MRLALLAMLLVGVLAGCNLEADVEEIGPGEASIPIPEQQGDLDHLKGKKPHNHPTGYVQPQLIQGNPSKPLASFPQSSVRVSALRGQALPEPKVELRLLLIAATEGENELITWRQILDRFGAAYDLLVATAEPDLVPARLIRADGTGRYQAIFLTTNNLSYDSGGGNYISAFSDGEWNVLWQYERDYTVRQVALYSFPDAFPEDYCTRLSAVTPVEDSLYPLSLTGNSYGLFAYLRTDVQIPLRFSYLYRATLEPTCAASNPTSAILRDASGAVLGVVSKSADGRERMAFYFSANPFFLYSPMLAPGILRWATRGLYLGEHQRFLNLDNDDFLNASSRRFADGTIDSTTGFRLSASDAVAASTMLSGFRQRWAGVVPANFTINLAYNGEGADLSAAYSCNSTVQSTDPLTSVARCLAPRFRWVNHSYSHLNMDKTLWAPYSVAKFEIEENLRVGRSMGFSVPARVLKPGELSGLGFFDPERTDPFISFGTPKDFGLEASNPEFLRAARDAGVRYVHSNFSVKSHKPPCHNCAIRHPLEPSLWLTPVRPNNIAYFVTDPAEEVSFYNYFYGPGGLFPFFSSNQNYNQIMDNEAEVALFDIISGSVYATYFHQTNMRQYAPGRSLMMDWLGAVMARYAQYYRAPVGNLGWNGSLSIGSYAEGRTLHQELLSGTRAVWNLTTGQVRLSASKTGRIFLSGATVGRNVALSGDRIGDISLAADQVLNFTVQPR
jgi:hypothetical protein